MKVVRNEASLNFPRGDLIEPAVFHCILLYSAVFRCILLYSAVFVESVFRIRPNGTGREGSMSLDLFILGWVRKGKYW